MDMATVVSKQMRKKGMLEDLEVSEEINACSVKIKVRVEDRITREERLEDYLLMFKNETHNHPTEIEPFGGASTCIGGAIRDPLSGRSYVYQAMRVTGSADPREKIEDTIEGKLPQRKITIDAARGYSSYGNQIGIATGHVDEIYHEGYKAKRMEVGAVIGAAPAENVKRESPVEGDLIILLGGRTGRDGVGGATGSSKEHTEKSIEISSAEVQKGNAPMERKLQRLFRNEGAAKLIKKCNDFGAGGVSVAIGELADSLEIYLDRVPLKYKGLTPREIAISESQERMAVVIDKDDLEKFAGLCYSENLEMTHVATVTDTGSLIMKYNDEIIVDIDRDFLNSSGADRNQDVRVENCKKIEFFNSAVICEDESGLNKLLEEKFSDLNSASKKNLIERFDSSIGRGSVLLPLGGKNQITPAQSMVALIPSLNGATKTASIMSYGFNPYLSEESPYLGAYYAVIESIAKIAAAGGNAL
jgi:phosphoribosylformylglycinamidine synthase